MSSIRSDLYNRMIELLVQARKDANMTQTQLGKLLGQRQTFVSKYELGERRLDAAEYFVIGRAIGANPYALIEMAEHLLKAKGGDDTSSR